MLTVRRGLVWTGCLVVALLASPGARAAAADAGVLDAKRKAAAQLMHDGHYNEALALIGEVTAADDKQYNDHLQLARALEKLSRSNEALREYKRVLELTSAGASGDERSARQEADKRVKQLDPSGVKIDAAVEDFQRKLDALERDAAAARSMSSMERLFKLRATLWQVEGRKDRIGLEVSSKLAWQDTGYEVREGMAYRVRGAGTWKTRAMDNSKYVETTANGIPNSPVTNQGHRGQLCGRVGGKYFILGEDKVFVAPASGHLELLSNDDEAGQRKVDTGSIMVLIEPKE